jgi:hypothetical protein
VVQVALELDSPLIPPAPLPPPPPPLPLVAHRSSISSDFTTWMPPPIRQVETMVRQPTSPPPILSSTAPGPHRRLPGAVRLPGVTEFKLRQTDSPFKCTPAVPQHGADVLEPAAPVPASPYRPRRPAPAASPDASAASPDASASTTEAFICQADAQRSGCYLISISGTPSSGSSTGSSRPANSSVRSLCAVSRFYFLVGLFKCDGQTSTTEAQGKSFATRTDVNIY